MKVVQKCFLTLYSVILSQEKITGGLFEPQNFSSYSRSLNRTAFLARKVSMSVWLVMTDSDSLIVLFFQVPVNQLFQSGHIKYSFRNVTGNVSLIKNARGLDKLGAAIELPSSVQKSLQGFDEARLFLSYYSTGAMFPLDEDKMQTKGERVEVSSVVAASLDGEKIRNLTDDVLITFQLGMSNYSNVTCVSWDFSASGKYHFFRQICCSVFIHEIVFHFFSGGRGEWVEDGCELLLTDGSTVVCSCNHLTNFACLVSIKDRVCGSDCTETKKSVSIALSILSVTGICVSILGLALTIITLAVFK